MRYLCLITILLVELVMTNSLVELNASATFLSNKSLVI